MLDKMLRALILISAGVTVVCRYAAFRTVESLSEQTVKLLNGLSYAGIAVLVVSGIIFAIIIKKSEKHLKNPEKDENGNGENGNGENG